ncbi:MAG: sigma-54 dependent transcriptional regulator [Spirochaetaceae bacterium]|jgi:DNA-binding NtrC family response regulator|nr:sigma-54 dependent transcriptional regulator [Spirochaetaceae bacterium]
MLCIDDMREELQNLSLQFQDHFKVIPCSRRAEALPLIQKEHPQAVILDIHLNGEDGFDILDDIQRLPSPPPVLMLSAYADPIMVVRALQNGARDFVAKPYSFALLRRRVDMMIQDERRSKTARKAPGHAEGGAAPVLAGSSQAMRRLREEISSYATSAMPVLLLGESGTGKDLAARAIHAASPRASGPYVVRNIASIPETLVASELFGCTAGAYTDAREQKGCFVLSDKGSLFLDEIGDAPRAIQASILRVIEDGLVRPLGSGEVYQTDCRLISATNQNLEKLIAEGRFREDLLYRIEGLTIKIPSLRSHSEDIPELVSCFLKLPHEDAPVFLSREISEEALALLMEHSWPGNIRQLKNCVHRAQLLAHGAVIQSRHIILGQR